VGGGFGAYATGTFFRATSPNRNPVFFYIHHTLTI
jgi:hypothetical protein